MPETLLRNKIHKLTKGHAFVKDICNMTFTVLYKHFPQVYPQLCTHCMCITAYMPEVA